MADVIPDNGGLAKQVIAAIVGGLVATLATLQTLGVRVSSVEVEMKAVTKQLDRIETGLDRLDVKRIERVPAERGH